MTTPELTIEQLRDVIVASEAGNMSTSCQIALAKQLIATIQREMKLLKALAEIARPLTPPGKTLDDRVDIHEIVDMLAERTAIARNALEKVGEYLDQEASV